MKELEEQLAKADVAIHNPRTHPDLSVRLAQYGYDDAGLAGGLALYPHESCAVGQTRGVSYTTDM